MVNRPKAHVVEDRSKVICRSLLPEEWILREIPSDYGVDAEVEIVEREIVTGKRFWMQIKGTESLDVREQYVAFKTDTKLLEYSLRCDFPLLLVVVDVIRKEAYWLPLRDEIEEYLELKNPKWREQASVTVRIPLENSFSKERENNFCGLRWYSMEPARMRAFSIMHYYYHELLHTFPWSETGVETHLDKFETRMLAKGLEKTRSLLVLTLGLDCLFGSHGWRSLIIMIKPKLEEGCECSNAILQRIQKKEDPFAAERKDISFFKIHSAVESLSTSITLYHEARGEFLFHQEDYQ
jgi:hypothetical protein